MATVEEALTLALDHHMAGRFAEADILYGRILDADADNPHALHLHGVLCAQTGRLEAAVPLLRRAVRQAPSIPDFQVNLANAHRACGQTADAAEAYRRAVLLAPERAEAWKGLGLSLASLGGVGAAVGALSRAGRLTPMDADVQVGLGRLLDRIGQGDRGAAAFARALAVEPASRPALEGLAGARQGGGDPAAALRLYQRLVDLCPEDAEAWVEQGLRLRRAARHADSADAFRRAAALRPAQVEAHGDLALALRDLGRPDEALRHARAAVALAPERPDALYNLAAALETLDRPGEAVTALRRVVRAVPDDAEAWSFLGGMLRRSGRIAAGRDACDRALALAPALLNALVNRAIVVQDFGAVEDGVRHNRRAAALAPNRADLHSNLLLSLQYSDRVGPADLLAEHRAWDARHGRPWTPPPGWRHPNAPDPERRLRIGYVSADFGYHPVGYFLAPVLPAHDRAAVEVFCYSAKPREDGMTRRLRAAADHWRSILGMDDAAAAALVAADGIDILVDLAGHTSGNRLPLFARKPAPVQATWAGYVGTTGLSAMDALIACPRHMPPGSDGTAVERVVRLPDDYVCALPREQAPEVGPLPALGNGFVTFGCFNNRIKLSGPVLALWARLLDRVPTARLLLKTHQFDDAAVRAGLLAEFAALGGDPARVDLSGSAPHFDFPAWYNRIDVALDPFPYSGGLTTLEALWMGVPVVTLGGGDRFCARHSVGHLTAAGLPDLIAPSRDAYLDIAAGLAADLPALAALRAGLRGRMAASPLCDGPRFARTLEAAYRDLWRGWCAARR